MTGRQLRRRAARHPVLAVVAVVVVALVLADLARWLPLTVAACAACYLYARRTRPASPHQARPRTAPPTPRTDPAMAARLASLGAERDQLAAKVADLEQQLADARASADLAWDAAAERPPAARPPADTDRRSTLLTDARSGARPLIPS